MSVHWKSGFGRCAETVRQPAMDSSIAVRRQLGGFPEKPLPAGWLSSLAGELRCCHSAGLLRALDQDNQSDLMVAVSSIRFDQRE